MDTSVIAIIVGVVALALFLIIMRRVVRMALRLVLIGVMLLALLVGGLVWWWYGMGDAKQSGGNRSRTTGQNNSR